MEFYEFNHIPKQEHPDCKYYNYGMVVVHTFVILWYLSYAFDWCRDPIATKLQKTIDTLEDENLRLKDYLGEVETALEDREEKIERLMSLISELRDVLKTTKPQEDVESDSELSSASSASDNRRKRHRHA
jgi:hypothetical protein